MQSSSEIQHPTQEESVVQVDDQVESLEMPRLESDSEHETPKKSSIKLNIPNAPKKATKIHEDKKIGGKAPRKSVALKASRRSMFSEEKNTKDEVNSYSKMSVSEMKKLLEERKIDGRSKLTKKDSIIRVLELFDQDPEDKEAIKALVNEIGTPKKVASKDENESEKKEEGKEKKKSTKKTKMEEKDDKDSTDSTDEDIVKKGKKSKTEMKSEKKEKAKKPEIDLNKTQIIPKEEVEEISKKLKKTEKTEKTDKKEDEVNDEDKKTKDLKKLAKQIIRQLRELSEQASTKDEESKSTSIMELDRIKEEIAFLL